VPAASPFVQKISWDQAQRPYWEQSRSLAAQIQQELLRLLQWPTGGVVQTDLYLLRRVEMPAVLVELGSLSHPGEAAELQRPEFQQKVSYAVSEAIKQYTRMREDEAAPSGQTQQ